jgi:hypothetical protein
VCARAEPTRRNYFYIFIIDKRIKYHVTPYFILFSGMFLRFSLEDPAALRSALSLFCIVLAACGEMTRCCMSVLNVCGLCLITVDEDTRTVSLPELESIFVALRLMDADAVYQAKQVLVMIDVWKFVFVLFEQSTNLFCVAMARKK